MARADEQYEHVRRQLCDLRPYPKNARTHSPQQIEGIANSIKEFGFTNPILIDEKNRIIAGHGRADGARKIGLKEVPCIVISGLTPTQHQALIIADNRLAELAGWDNDLLVQELGELLESGLDLDLVGFSDQDLANLLHGVSPSAGEADPDDVPEPPVHPVSVPGDVWLLGDKSGHILVCGDSTDPLVVEKALKGVKPHLLVSDPPYGVDYDPTWRGGLDKIKRSKGKVANDTKADWREAFALFPGDVAYVWHSQLFAKEVQISLEECGFKLRSQIVWVKPHFVLSRGDYHSQHECLYYMVKESAKGHWNGSRKETTVWQIANGTFQGGSAKPEDAKTGHGTQKPVECMRRPIENNSSPGQAVYEPFCGSGGTIIACEQTGRICHAIEIEPKYVDVCIKRWQTFTGKTAVLEGVGKTYAEMATERA